jgi:hypothetical protein
MSEAYASTLYISFDVRGGLLIRQMHHWAALIFVAAMAVHAFRVFFTGAYRKPREFNWLVGVPVPGARGDSPATPFPDAPPLDGLQIIRGICRWIRRRHLGCIPRLRRRVSRNRHSSPGSTPRTFCSDPASSWPWSPFTLSWSGPRSTRSPRFGRTNDNVGRSAHAGLHGQGGRLLLRWSSASSP